MLLKNYEHLCKVYDIDWGNFAIRYVKLINEIINARNIDQAKILDLACGTGNLAMKLAESGHKVRGIDISSEMIQVAKNKSVHIKNVSFEVQDMVRVTAEEKYDLVTCTFDSINYLINVDDVKTMISNVSNVLNNSGLFIFDFNTEQQYLKYHKGTFQKEIGGESFIQRAIYKSDEKIALTEFEFEDGDVEVHKQRPYCLSELENVLAEAELNLIDIYSGFDGKGYLPESERLICIVEK